MVLLRNTLETEPPNGSTHWSCYSMAVYNPDARPFMWTATTDSILNKIQRRCTAISEICCERTRNEHI